MKSNLQDIPLSGNMSDLLFSLATFNGLKKKWHHKTSNAIIVYFASVTYTKHHRYSGHWNEGKQPSGIQWTAQDF